MLKRSNVSRVLWQVTTKLENPTRYHVMQKQKTQMRTFLNESQIGIPAAAQSMPNYRLSSSSDVIQQQTTLGGSAPVDPDSPLSMGMSSTSMSEVCFFFTYALTARYLKTAFPVLTPLT